MVCDALKVKRLDDFQVWFFEGYRWGPLVSPGDPLKYEHNTILIRRAHVADCADFYNFAARALSS